MRYSAKYSIKGIRMVLTVFFLHICILVLSQSNTWNYVKIENTLDGSFQTMIEYYDGLGRTRMTVTNGASGNGNSTYTRTDYQGLSRVARKWNATFGPSGLNCQIAGFSGFQSANLSDSQAYEDYEYDGLDRLTYTATAGSIWHNAHKGRKKEYSSNNSQQVKRYVAPIGNTQLQQNGYYDKATLYATVVEDEDCNTVITFMDKEGKVVMERRASSPTVNHDTYYVYNDFGQLRFVLTPQFQQTASIDLYAYEYRYDNRGNVVKKILPGSEYIQYWYDNKDRPIFMQDARLRSQGKYRFTLYDRKGNLCIEGTCTQCTTTASMPTVHYDTNNAGFLSTGYVLDVPNVVSTSNASIDIVRYYDNYNFLTHSSTSQSFSGVQMSSSIDMSGLETGKKVKASNGAYIYYAMLYDEDGRCTETRSTTLLGTVESVKRDYSITGKVKKSEYAVSGIANRALHYIQHTSYNSHNDKPETVSFGLVRGTGTPTSYIHTASYTYDDLGRLSGTQKGNSSLDIQYAYNLHGWLTSIESPSFKEYLYYANGQSGQYYNGNISSLKWRNTNYSSPRWYDFTYDKMNRLTDAQYIEGDSHNQNANRYREQVSLYDLNGNPQSVSRWGKRQNGTYGLIDALSYTWSGNQLYKISDSAPALIYDGAADFSDTDNGSAREYTYDGTGALTSDLNKGIVLIEYDDWGMPKLIQFSDGSQKQMVYTAEGIKLRTSYYASVPNMTLSANEEISLTSELVSMTSQEDFLLEGTCVMQNGQPARVMFEGGYCNLMLNPIPYYYYVNDHLGNVREVVSSAGIVMQVNNYYPFGTPYFDNAVTAYNPTLQPYKYNGKEWDHKNGLYWYDYGARMYDPVTLTWDRMDPLCEKYYNVSPYCYCGGNPVNVIDPTGCDTLNIAFNQGKWIFSDPIIAKGDDVFNVTIDGVTNAYTFSEGEYGDRVDALNLESNEDYTLGVYHISGVSSQGTGYYVTPGGPPSTRNGSKARIPEGIYPIIEGRGTKWKKAGVGGSVEGRGIRFHYEVSRDHNPRWSTDGCFVLSYDYTTHNNGSIIYNRNESISASRNFDILVGGAYPYINKNNGREATKFLNPITAILSLKSRTK